MQEKEQVIARLQSQGKRITKQRQVMLDVILERDWDSCKEIYFAVSRRDPGIGRATVYRMVRTLEDMGVIHHVYQYDVRSHAARQRELLENISQ